VFAFNKVHQRTCNRNIWSLSVRICKTIPINIQNLWVSRLCPSSGILNKQTTQHSGNRPNFANVVFPIYLEFRMMDKVKKRNDSEVQCLRSALSKEPNGVNIFLPSPEDGNRSSLPNVVLYRGLELRTWTNFRPCDSECYMQSLKLFRFYLNFD
jgi:hypothetical protein